MQDAERGRLIMDNDVITIEECISRLDIIRHELVSGSRDHFALSAGIAALYEMKSGHAVNSWIPCSERLPEQTGYYLVCDAAAEFDNIRGRREVAKFVIGRHGGHWYGAIRRECITHWMPLPEPPEGY